MAEAIVHIMMNEGCDDLFPKKNYKSDVGFDLFAAEDVTLNYNEVKAVSVGFKMEMENGWEAQIRSRSGNALKAGLMVVNSPGTIDCVTKNAKILTVSGKEITAEEIFNRNSKTPIISFNEASLSFEEDIITDCWIVNNKKLLKLDCGETSVIVPEEKEIFTSRGWIQAKYLNENDEILYYKQ